MSKMRWYLGEIRQGWMFGWMDAQTGRQCSREGLETMPNQEWKEEKRTKKGWNNVSPVGGRLEHSG